MAVFRVHKTRDFTIMSNCHLRDARLTLKAKGLLSVILSLPDDWKYSVAGLAAICKEGTSAVKSALDELEESGYVIVTKLYPNQTETGRIEYAYDIHERPQQGACKQGVENLGVESQGVENHAQISTDELSTDVPSTKNKTNRGFAPPSVDEVKAYCQERRSRVDPEAFVAYYSSQGWRKANGQRVTDWKGCVRTWERKDGRTNDSQARGTGRNDDLESLGYLSNDTGYTL